MLKVKQDTPVEPNVLAVLEHVRAVSGARGKLGKFCRAEERFDQGRAF